MQRQVGYRRPGISLVELLVVLGILVVFLGMLLPAIQQARESANFAHCQENLRQIGIAFSQHHTEFGVYPHNGGWDGKQTIRASDGSLFTPSTFDKSLGMNFKWGVGQPGLTPTEQTGPWCYSLLPFLDQQSMHENRDWTHPVSTFVCLSRRNVEAYEVASEDAYGVYEGGGWKWGKTDYSTNGYVVGPRPTCMRLGQITDGASNTLLAGERAFDAAVHMPHSWYYDRPFFLGGGATTTQRGVEVIRDGRGIEYKQNWGSPHTGGANALFVDGSVRVLAFGSPWKIMAPLLSPDDGELPDKGGD